MRARLITFIVAGFLIGALAGAAILLVTTPHGGQPVQSSGTALVGGPFSLVGADGKTVTDADFRGRYMLVFFGFTHCPDICPAELQVIAQSLDKLGDKAEEGGARSSSPSIPSGTRPRSWRLCQELRAEFRGADRLAGGDCRRRQGVSRRLCQG